MNFQYFQNMQKHLFHALLGLLILLNASPVTAQNQEPVSPSALMSMMELIRNDEGFEDKTVFLARVSKKADKKDRTRFKAAGLDLQQYSRTHDAYLAVIDKKILPNALQEAHVIQLKKFLPEHKKTNGLKKALEEKSFPAHAVKPGGRIKINIRTFKGFSEKNILTYLSTQGAEIEYSNAQSRRIILWTETTKLERLIAADFCVSAEIADEEPKPEYNEDRSNHRANFLSQDFAGGNQFNGEGIKLMIQDDGIIGPHIDYEGRVMEQFMTSNNGDHGDHCSGILMGAGNKDPLTKGMAWGADLFVYRANSYQGFDSIYQHYFSRNITITSTSYADGCNVGYTSLAAELDEQIYDLPLLMHVFSAGNNGTQDCNYGAGAGWGNITGGHKHSKNSISVGNLDYLDNLASSSSRGPVHDGRLKPEVCGVGTSVYSTIDSHSYDTKTGTSMSCPGAAGALAMMSQAYKSQYNVLPHSSLLKAMVMNTSDDLGNKGPDFKFGYGRINGRKSLQPITQQYFLTDSVSDGQSNTHQIFIPAGLHQAKILICWNDYPAAEAASPALINDLDMQVQSAGGNSYQPLVLNTTPDATLLDLPAVPGTDHLNNHEQIVIDFPQAGNYQILVNGFDVPFGPQVYSITWYFEELKELVLTYPNGGEAHAPGENITIRWDASEDTTGFALEYSVDSAQVWTSINPNVASDQRALNFQIPAGLNPSKMKMKISRGFSIDHSDRYFDVLGIPQNLNVYWVCEDSLMLRWNQVPGADAYDVFILGNKYMDSLSTTSADSMIIYNINAAVNQYWFAVRARTQNGIVGRRCIAIQSPLSTNCPKLRDASVTAISSPAGPYFTCMNTNNIPVQITLKNEGLRDIFQIPVFYQLNADPAQTVIYADTLSYNQSANFTFPTSINFTAAGNYVLKIWTTLNGDQIADNDTMVMMIRVIQAATVNPPWTEDFESFGLCTTSSNCEAEICNLSNGMLNLANGEEDDIDWRVHSGATPTNASGPSQDYLPGTASGKYLYIEPSGNCFQQKAVLMSPCINLSNFATPRLTFAYHMYGAAMGEFNVDIYANGNWINSVFYRTGDQDDQWRIVNLPLTAYGSQTIVVRFRAITGSGETGDLALDGIMVGNVSGVEESGEKMLSVYPHPNDGKFRIVLPEGMAQSLDIHIFSAEGKRVYSSKQIGTGHQQELELNLELSPGMYFLSVGEGEKRIWKKLLIGSH